MELIILLINFLSIKKDVMIYTVTTILLSAIYIFAFYIFYLILQEQIKSKELNDIIEKTNKLVYKTCSSLGGYNRNHTNNSNISSSNGGGNNNNSYGYKNNSNYKNSNNSNKFNNNNN
jgi:hypothetical protein